MSSPDSSPFLTPEGDTMLGQNPPGQTNTGDSEDEMTEDVDYNLPLTPMASDTEQVPDLTAIADMYPQATTLASPEPWTPSIRDERPSEVDESLVRYLIAVSTDFCSGLPRNFRAWLRDVVLKPGHEDELQKRVEYHLRNPALKSWGFQTSLDSRVREFWRKISKYEVVKDWDRPVIRPYAEFPEEYLPPSARSQHTILDSGMDSLTIADPLNGGLPLLEPAEVGGISREATDAQEEEEEEEEEESDVEDWGMLGEEDEHRPKEKPGPRRRWAKVTSTGPASERHNRLVDLMERLDLIPPMDVPGDQRIPQGESGRRGLDTAEVAEAAETQDWTTPSKYKGGTFPPLAQLLKSTINFLAEEDVDRCENWDRRFQEVVDHLFWLGCEDVEDNQVLLASPKTRAMYEKAVMMAKTHVVFEKHHYGITLRKIGKEPRAPVYPNRLAWVGQPQGATRLKEALPRPVCPRLLETVHPMELQEAEENAILDAFALDETRYHNEYMLQEDNMARIEDDAYLDGLKGMPWKFSQNPATVNKTDWARDRGTRRAGLQQILRALGANENQTQWEYSKLQVVLPIDAATWRSSLKRITNPAWKLPSCDFSQDCTNYDPLFFTWWYARTADNIASAREIARRRTYSESVRLSKNLPLGGPFVWREVGDADANIHEQMRMCEVALDVLRAANRRTPRPLLRRMLDVVALAAADRDPGPGSFDGHHCHFEDVQWIKFVCGRSVNEGTWSGRFHPDTPKAKYKRFLSFATRVQRLLDDPGPDGLFAEADAAVTVEELLEVLNAGWDSSAIGRYQFNPFEASAWLRRMHKSRHVRFTRDLGCYGIIQRPILDFHPEDRVRFPPDSEEFSPPSFFGGIVDWETVVRAGHSIGMGEGSRVWNFFTRLACRLGRTFRVEGPQLNNRLDRPRKETLLEAASSFVENYRPYAEIMRRSAWNPGFQDHENKYPEEMTEKQVAQLAREKIIGELNTNKSMLYPARRLFYWSKQKGYQFGTVRDFHWDWASEKVRGGPCKTFFSLTRWPVNWLSENAARAIKGDINLDPTVNYDPAALDPIPGKWLQPRLRRWGEDDDKPKVKVGPAVFRAGDTPRQARAIQQYLTQAVNQSFARTSGDVGPPRGFKRKYASFRDEGAELPLLSRMNPSLIPRSWDPAEERGRAEQVATKAREARLTEDARQARGGDYEMNLDDEMDTDYRDLSDEE